MSPGPDTRGVLQIEDDARVRRLTLDRAGALNAFNDDLYDAVRDALVDAAERPDIACVVITGAGRAFSAGQDLGEMGQPRGHTDDARHGFAPFIEVVESFPKPLLAAVNGLAVGIGLTLLPHCDLVLISEKARLRAPFVSLGLTAEAGSTALLPPRIGWQQTAHLLYTASWIYAAKAVEIGLAWRVLPAEKLLAETMAIAAEIAAMPVESLVATKRLLIDARLDGIRDARKREDTRFAALLRGPASREAIAAFREKRPPNFANLPKQES